MDVIIVSQVIIVLEAMIVTFIVGFVAFVILKATRKNKLADRQKKQEEKFARMNFQEREVWTDIQERISNAEKLLGHPPTRAGQSDMNQYDPQQIEGWLTTMSLKQRKEWSEWQVRLAKAETQEQEEKNQAALIAKFGQIQPEISCPHCCAKGKVRTKSIQQDKGINGGKVATAVITGGVSLLMGVGSSKSENNTQAKCGNCNNTWAF